MAKQILKNVKIDGQLTSLIAENGVISYIGDTDLSGIDCEGYTLLPGLFDIHTHGANGLDTMDSSLEELSKYYFEHGITSFLPTTMTMPISDIEEVCKRFPEKRIEGGAKIEGLHLEGPYVAESKKGAQNGAYLRNPTLDDLNHFSHVKMMTLAPELPGAIDFIQNCGFQIAIGHTDADYDTALNAFKAGATNLTHTFNAMPPIHHRNPGVIGAAITANAYAQIITDGVHVHPSMILMIYKTFGPDRMIIISDSLRATGLADGVYSFGGQEIHVVKGVARTDTGALAGSTTNLFECVKCCIKFGIPAKDAFKMASETPATMLGLKKGRLEVGYDAEFILVDEHFNLIKSIIL